MARQLPAAVRQIGPVAAGLGVLGLASFAFLAVSGRALGPAELAPLVTLWVLINALGPALFQPLEQEVGRTVAHRAALGDGARPVFLRACLLASAWSRWWAWCCWPPAARSPTASSTVSR
ncbi:hypothetical protein A7K94_0209425 [Modestobacter sp. VKM Ac-2676]|nr:hypothetical protein A7K94_0209425 [Modestobacter sp. VKM Ac-2676]